MAEEAPQQAPEAPPTSDQAPGEVAEKPESAPAPGDAKPEEPPRKKGGFQKRIDKLTKHVYELQAQLEAARQSRNEAPAGDKEPRRDDFDDLETYQKALAEHTAKRVFKEHRTREEEAQRQRTAQEAQRKRVETWESHVSKASDKYDDGEDVLEHFVSNVELHPYALDAVLESDLGSELAYYLGKHDEEADRISKLSPARQAIEIGKLEVKLASAPKKASAAPAPIDPVTGKGSAEPGLSEELPMKEWMKRRQKQVHGR